jgi:Na+/H+ antiporter NhaC
MKKGNNLLKEYTILIGVILVIVFIAFIGFNEKTKSAKEEVKKYPKEDLVREIFVGGCTDGDVTKKPFCNCGYDYIIDTMGYENAMKEFMEMEETGVIAPVVLDATLSCIDLY